MSAAMTFAVVPVITAAGANVVTMSVAMMSAANRAQPAVMTTVALQLGHQTAAVPETMTIPNLLTTRQIAQAQVKIRVSEMRAMDMMHVMVHAATLRLTVIMQLM